MLDRIRRKLRVDLTPFVLSTARRGGGNGSRNLHSPSYVHSIVCILASSTRVASMLFCEGYIILVVVFWSTFTVFTTPIPMQIILYTLRA